MKNHLLTRVLLILSLSVPSIAFANDEGEINKINQLLNDFLANSIGNDFKNHDRFWAEDLVYTSSNGTRFDKSFILSGIDDSSASEDAPVYWAEDTDIRLYDKTAIVAFKLQAKWTEHNEIKTQSYFNTGTMLKRNGVWQVIAWQATKILTKE